MKPVTRHFLAPLLAIGIATPLCAQAPATDALRLTVSGYAQFQFNTTSVGEEDMAAPGQAPVASSLFETRRVRLYADVTMNDWIMGRIQPEYAMGRLSLADVFMNFGFDERFELRVGQFKRPFSPFYVISSTQILTIERGIRIRGFDRTFGPSTGAAASPYTAVDGEPLYGEEHEILGAMGLVGRDIGVAAHGRLGRAAYEVAVFNGDGADTPDGNDGKSVMARVAYAPLADVPLTVGAAASYRELYFDGEVDGQPIADRDLDGAAFGLDLEWGRFRGAGVHALAEVTTGENLYVDGRILGVQGILAYFRPLGGTRLEGIELVARASYGDPNTSRSDDHGMLLTPGVNLYFSGRNRLMLNWDLYRPGDDRLPTGHALRAQTQFYFGVPVPAPPDVVTTGSRE